MSPKPPVWAYFLPTALLLMAPFDILASLAMDIYLPIVPAMPGILGTSPAIVQLTLSLYMVMLGLGQIIGRCTWSTYDATFSLALDAVAADSITHVIFGDILFAEHRLDALVAPTTPATAVRADHPFVDWADGPESVMAAYTRLTYPFNVTGQPVLALPCGFDAAGLPVSLQLAGRPFAEATLCRIGHAYERTTGWWQRRPTV